jgi:hypothetical protein
MAHQKQPAAAYVAVVLLSILFWSLVFGLGHWLSTL